MKKYVTTSLFIFLAISSGVVIVNLISNNTNSQVSTVKAGVTSLTLSSTELTKHNSGQSC